MLETARRGELAHAVILHGPSADNLRATAMQIAKSLNCMNGTTGDDCTSCSRIERRMHPDVHFIEVAGERKLISVEQIRELLEGAPMRPYEGRNKVFIIDPADGLSVSGSSSLLKTLEEPTRDTTFLLLTRTPDLLLPTIRSRSQPVYVGGVETVDDDLRRTIVAALTRFAEKSDATALLALASAIGGRDDAKDAIALLASTMIDAVGDESLAIPKEKLLAAADTALGAIRWLSVNADPRMLVEQVLANLV
ncbi:MAG: polymerase delta prime subunit [Acidobacteria bacterium]|nr:polymerase delta prime subunit [Acidobacteriota bacterium]